MAFTGVNRSNVAVTDTFDTWRIRTNEINTSLNAATAANTADTIMWRDDAGSANVNILNANTTVITHTGSSDTALSIVSGVAAQSDGTYASIKTTGGLYATLSSKFAADLTIGTNLSVEGNTTLGNAGTDTIAVTGGISSNVNPSANSTQAAGAAAGSFIGQADKLYAHVYSAQGTINAHEDVSANVFSVTSANGAGNTAVLLNNAITTGGILQVLSSSTDTSERELVHINQSGDAGASSALSALKITTASGIGLNIDANDANGKQAVYVDSAIATTNSMHFGTATTTATGAHFQFNSLTDGSGIDVTTSSSNLTTGGALVEISQTSGTMSSANVATLSLNHSGNGTYGLLIDSKHATANSSIRVDSIATTKNIIEVVDNALTTGDMMQFTTSAPHTGQLISLSSTSTADSARGEAIKIQYNTANTSAIAFKIANNSADSFTVSQAGDVVMGGNLEVKGTTTQINTTTTIAQDTSMVLGAQSDVKTGATYTAANPAVVTSTAHGLNNNDIIFIVASSGTAIVSEQLVKVTDKTTNTFEAATIAGVDINGTGDSTSRTFSWVGPQLDSAANNAGILVPGSTAVHSLIWEDDEKYWELNDSIQVESTGQLVFPKGTTAQQPGGSVSGTTAAATTGAMRFNTTNAKFEGVTSGTTFENMSTEGFSISVAIALG